MADFIRLLGICFAAANVGALIIFALAEKGTTAFAPPARYWGVATGLSIVVPGIVYRFNLWGDPFSPRDLIFLVSNVLMCITVVLSLRQGAPKAKEGSTDG